VSDVLRDNMTTTTPAKQGLKSKNNEPERFESPKRSKIEEDEQIRIKKDLETERKRKQQVERENQDLKNELDQLKKQKTLLEKQAKQPQTVSQSSIDPEQ